MRLPRWALLLVLLLIPHRAYGQLGQRVSVVQNAQGLAIPSITVTACSYSAGQYSLISGVWTYTGVVPCTPTIPVFADPAGANPINPVLSSGNGNYSYWVSPANYTECVTGTQITGACYVVQVGGTGGGGGSALPAAPGLSLQFANLAGTAFASVSLSGVTMGIDSLVSPTKIFVPLQLVGANVNGEIVVDGVLRPFTDAGIQSAINAAPSGGSVYLPVGSYTISTGNILITQPITIHGAGKGTNLVVGAGVPNTSDIFVINPTADGNFIRLADFQISGTAAAARYPIHVNGASATIQSLSIERVFIQQLGNSAAVPNTALYMEGSGLAQGTPVLANIKHNEFIGGIVITNCGDTVRIIDNQISFVGKIDISCQPGVSTLIMQGNNISVLGGIHLGTGMFAPQIIGNEIETPVGFTGSNGSVVDIDGTVGSPIANPIVERNSIQVVNSITSNGIRLNWSNNAQVFGNVLERGLTTSKDILITANATNTSVGTNEWANGVPWTSMVADSGTRTSIASQFNGGLLVGAGPVGTANCGIASIDNTGALQPLLCVNASDSSVNLYGRFGALVLTGVTGATYLYDGSSPGVITGAFAGATNSQPTAGTMLNLATLSYKEISSPPSGASGFDLCYGDATAHALKCNFNNGGYVSLSGANYQTLLNNGTAKPTEPAFDLVAGANMTVTCTDSASVKTVCTFISTNTAATAWSAITAATNANAGTFAASGNTWDFSAATAFKMPSAGFTEPGSGSGLISFLTQAAAGTYNWNWPTTAGTAGFFLTSQGGGANPLTYTSNITTINGTPCTTGSSCTAIQLQTNTVSNATQNLLNLLNSTANLEGLSLTFTNTGTGVVKAEIGGLTNSTGGGTGVSAPTAHSLLVAEGINAFNLVPSPTINGFYVCGYNIFASVAQDPTCTLQGVPIIANASSPVTLTAAADVTLQQFTSASAQAVTGPPLANNITFAMYVTGAGGVTYTPATGSVNGVATQVAPKGSFCFEYTDNSNTQMPCMPTYLAIPNTGANQALTFNSTTNVISFLGNIAIGPASSTNGDLACWNGTSGLLLSDCGSLGTNLISSTQTQTSGAIAIGAGTKTLGAPLAATGPDYIVIASAAGAWTQIQINGDASCGDATHALKFTAGAPGSIGCQAVTGSAAAGGSNTQIQWNNATALAGITQWTTNGTTTVTGGSTGVLDLSAMAPASGLKLPSVAGAIPTADGFDGFNTTIHAQVWGSNGTTIVGAAAGTGTTASTTCTNQFFTVISATAAPTCGSVSLTAAVTGILPKANGGTNASTWDFAAQTDAATVTWAIASATIANASLTFTVHSGSRTLNITNPVNGGSYVLWLKQDGTGGEGLTLGTGCTWKVQNGGAGAITPSVSANAIDVLAFTYDGTNCYATFSKNFN